MSQRPLANALRSAWTQVQDAKDNMRGAPQRTLLSLLGIGIGAAAVVALLNIGENTSDEAARQLQAMGTDLIVVQGTPNIGSDRYSHSLTREDATALLRQVPTLDLAAPLSAASAKTSAGGRMLDAMAIGATQDLMDAARLRIQRGRFVANFDGRSAVVVVGGGLARTLSAGAKDISPGDRIRLDRYLFTVVGVLESAPRNPLLPFDIDNALIIPIQAERRLSMATGTVSNLLIRVKADAEPAQALAHVSSHLRSQRRSAQAQGALQLIDAMRQQGQMFKWMLGGVACMSLLVGGIGIMNAMLAGITERKREIGLRLAIGADRGSIMTMIIAESLLLAIVGGCVGTLVGMAASLLFAFIAGWQPTLSATASALGLGMSLATGLFFGIYPAFKASKLSPIEALVAD